MSEPNRWAKEEYPDYRQDVDKAIGFTPVDMDHFLRGKADAAIALLDKHVQPSASAACLDIGCGIGAMHPSLAGRVRQLHGVDVSEDAVRSAEAANPGVHYRVYDGVRLPYDDGSHDMTLTVCVMHHVPPQDRAAFIAEAWRVTRPGGIFAVFEHNPVNPLTRLAVMRCPFDHDAVLLWPGETRSLLAQQGFQVLETSYLFFLPLKQRWAARVDRALSWLPLGAQYVVCGRRV